MLKTALVVSLKAVSKIVLICAGGAYLEKTGVLHKEMRKGVSEAFVKLLLPCLLFTRILPTMSVETLPKLGWLAMANLLYVSLVTWAMHRMCERSAHKAATRLAQSLDGDPGYWARKLHPFHARLLDRSGGPGLQSRRHQHSAGICWFVFGYAQHNPVGCRNECHQEGEGR